MKGSSSYTRGSDPEGDGGDGPLKHRLVWVIRYRIQLLELFPFYVWSSSESGHYRKAASRRETLPARWVGPIGDNRRGCGTSRVIIGAMNDAPARPAAPLDESAYTLPIDAAA